MLVQGAYVSHTNVEELLTQLLTKLHNLENDIVATGNFVDIFHQILKCKINTIAVASYIKKFLALLALKNVMPNKFVNPKEFVNPNNSYTPFNSLCPELVQIVDYTVDTVFLSAVPPVHILDSIYPFGVAFHCAQK